MRKSLLLISLFLTCIYITFCIGQVLAEEQYEFVNKWGSFGTLGPEGPGSGDGQFNNPHDIALDSLGNMYIADSNNQRIQKLTSNGEFVAKWGSYGSSTGGPGAGVGQFYEAHFLALDGSGNIYVADTENHRIQKFTSSGEFITMWGSYGSGDGQFNNPVGIAVDASGNVYVAERNERIQKFTSNGDYIAKWGSPGSENGQFGYLLHDIAVDNDGYVYVVDTYNARIQKFTSSGQFITKWGSPGSGDGQFNYPVGITVDNSGNVYVTDDNHRVQKFTSSGEYIAKWGSYGTGDGQFSQPRDVVVDGSGKFYVTDWGNNRIQKFSENGDFIAKWGNHGSGEGEFNAPCGLALDSSENVYIMQVWNNCLQKYTNSGQLITQIPSSDLLDGQFYFPSAIDIDNLDNVYVADTNNHRIQKFTSDGQFMTKWGTLGIEDGEFAFPGGIAVDKTNNWVYVADTNNNRIQKFSASGQFLDKWGVFNRAIAVEVDNLGNVYVISGYNYSLSEEYFAQKFTGSGSLIYEWRIHAEDIAGSAYFGPIFSVPRGLTLDNSGNVYISFSPGPDYLVSPTTVRKYTNSGVLLERWDKEVHFRGMTSDNAGNIYAADFYDHSIKKFTSSGQFIAEWNKYIPSPGQFYWPSGIALDNSGNIYITDWANHRIQEFTTSGDFVTMWGSQGSEDGQFIYPEMIAVDIEENVYVGEQGPVGTQEDGNNRIQKFDSSGDFISKWGSYGTEDGQFIFPSVAVDDNGYVYVPEWGNHRVQKFTSDGVFVKKWGSYGTGPGQFNTPYGIAVDNTANVVYITDAGASSDHYRIQKFDTSGNFLDEWEVAGEGQYDYADLAVDSQGNVYSAEFESHHIQKFNSSGVSIAKWGNYGTGDGEFNHPCGIAVDNSGYVYVSDWDNHRIQVFKPKEMLIESLCPVYMIVTDPQGRTISKDATIPGTIYEDNIDLNGDGILEEDRITIKYVLKGDYLINVVPEENANPEETYTLRVVSDNKTIVIANNVKINDIPSQPSVVESTQTTVTIKPMAQAGIDMELIAGENGQFRDNGSSDADGTIVSYQWDFGDGSYGSGPVSTHAYTLAGMYIAKLIVTDNDSATATDTIQVTVITLSQAIDELINMAKAMNLKQGINNSLDAKLQAAKDSLNSANAGNRNDAINKLQAFINAVEAQRNKELTNDQANQLVNYAKRIISALGGVPVAPTLMPNEFKLTQNYPNPFNPDTWIPYQLPEDLDVSIRIYNISGNLIRTLTLGYRPSGFYTSKDKAAYWDGKNEDGEQVSSGIYFYTIQAGDFTATKKMVIAR